MNSNSGKSETEDYGGPSDEDKGSQGGQRSQDSSSGGGSGDSGDGGDGGQFGEFENTGVGTDLTVEMENTDARTGMVKGGEEGADDVAGPGQYGGAAGGLSEK